MYESDDEAAPRAFSRGAAYAYQQVADDIAGRIRAGEWRHDARLPSRDELAAEYGVAERTVRRAMQELEADGMVIVVPAKGVYVAWEGTRRAHEDRLASSRIVLNHQSSEQPGQHDPNARSREQPG